MSPEIEVSEEQGKAVIHWAKNHGKNLTDGWIVNSGWIFKIGEEPLVILNHYHPIAELRKHQVIASEKIAKELEKAGVVSFSEAEVAKS